MRSVRGECFGHLDFSGEALIAAARHDAIFGESLYYHAMSPDRVRRGDWFRILTE
jgi:hypothetical protein